jgi:hypothetical protein
VDPLDHEDTVFGLDLADRVGDESSLSRADLTRLQRASEGAGQSAGGGRDDVVKRRSVLGLAAARNAVVVGDLVVNAEGDRVALARYKRAAKRAAHALDPNPRVVTDLGHRSHIQSVLRNDQHIGPASPNYATLASNRDGTHK